MIKFLVKGQNIETLEHEIIAADISQFFLTTVTLCRNMVKASTPTTMTVIVLFLVLQKVISISAVQRITMLCTLISLILAGLERYLFFV